MMSMYVALFGIGIGFIILSLVMDTFMDVNGPLALFQPKLIAAFLIVAGGVGIIMTRQMDGAFAAGIILTISVLSGLFIAGLIHRFIIIPLHNAQNTSAFDKQATIGTTATVTSPIPQGGYGKIRYNISGSVVTSPAKSDDGGEIKNGENVNIVYIEGSTYFVRRKEVGHTN